MIKRYGVSITSDASGDGIGYTPILSGLIHAIRYVKNDYTDGVDITITGETSTIAVVTLTNQNASATTYPRAATNDVIGAASLFAGAGEPVECLIPVAQERMKIVVAAGGDTKTGMFHVFVEE
jgi:hypothetical protein